MKWPRQTHAHTVYAHTPTNTHLHTLTHQSPKGQTAFVSVMRGSERQREALLEKRAVVFSSPKSLGLIREDISELERSTRHITLQNADLFMG